jgi:hypothetical protein
MGERLKNCVLQSDTTQYISISIFIYIVIMISHIYMGRFADLRKTTLAVALWALKVTPSCWRAAGRVSTALGTAVT